MFTGLVEETGEVLSFHAQPESWRLKLRGKLVSEDLQIGDSIAVNGCCLSVTETSKHTLVFDVLEETRLVTNLKDMDLGSKVNLERSLRHDGRLGGHFVTGHVDCVGKIREIRHKGRDVLLRIEAPKPFSKYMDNGSILPDQLIGQSYSQQVHNDNGTWYHCEIVRALKGYNSDLWKSKVKQQSIVSFNDREHEDIVLHAGIQNHISQEGHDILMGRLLTDILHLLNKMPIDYFSKK